MAAPIFELSPGAVKRWSFVSVNKLGPVPWHTITVSLRRSTQVRSSKVICRDAMREPLPVYMGRHRFTIRRSCTTQSKQK
jgi:hypothetical protein